MADRVLVIGLDMGDFALIEKWSVEGRSSHVPIAVG